MYTPRLRVLETVVKEIRAKDPDSVITVYLLRQLHKKGLLGGIMIGSKLIVNMDEYLRFFKTEVQDGKA